MHCIREVNWCTLSKMYTCIYKYYIYKKSLSRCHTIMCSNNARKIVRFMLQLSSEPLRDPSKGILGDRIQGIQGLEVRTVRFTESARASIYWDHCNMFKIDWDHCNMKPKSLTSPHESFLAGGQVDIKSSKCRQILFGLAVCPWNFHPRLCWVPLVWSLFCPLYIHLLLPTEQRQIQILTPTKAT